MSVKSTNKNNNHDKATLSGNVHATITLLHDPLHLFVADKVKKFSQTTTLVAGNHVTLESLDFSQLLQYVKKNWKQQFAHCCAAELKKVATDVIKIRNNISHQGFELKFYQSYMKQLAKLASLINHPEIEQKIYALLTIGIAEADAYVSQEEKQWWQLKDEGNNFYTKECWTEAMNSYTNAIHLNSTQAVLFSNRALCELQLKQYQLAREDMEKAILLDSSKIKYYRILSESLEKLNLFDESFEICKKGLSIDPRDDTLLIRKRDCGAYIAKADTDYNNPRFWLKEGTTYEKVVQETRKQTPKLFNAMLKLTPKPEDVEIVSQSAYFNICRLTVFLGTAHKLLTDHRHDVTFERKAFEIFEAAAKEEFAEGLFNTGMFYLQGRGSIIRDTAKAEELFLKTAKQKPYYKYIFLQPNLGVAEAEGTLGNMFREGNGKDKDDRKAFQWYLKSAEHGCPEGQNNLGHYLRYGIGCKQDLASARTWFERAVEKNTAEAQCNLAELLSEGEGGEKDVHRAAELYKAAANQGMPKALDQLQHLVQTFALGPVVKDATQTLLKEISAAPNDPHACLLLGMNYYKGEGGVEIEFGLSEKCLKKAVELGNNDALLPLAELLSEMKRNEEAFTYLEKACEIGNKEAYFTFGKYCAYGHGCIRNVEKSVKWLNRANSLTKTPKDDVVDVDLLLSLGNQIVDWEISSNNKSSGFSLAERVHRYLANQFLGLDEQEISKVSLQLSTYFRTRSLPSMDSSIKRNTGDWSKQMLECAQSGSKSAQNFFFAMKQVLDAELLISNCFYTEGFQAIRLARRSWDLLIFNQTILDGANKALLQNPDNSEALFFQVIACSGRSLNEKVRLLRRCIEISPLVPDFHEVLGSCYGFVYNYKDALRELNRALELEFCPTWLYTKATIMRLDFLGETNVNQDDAKEAIFAYKTFLNNNPRDERKTPEAYFSIGYIYMLLNDSQKAKRYWEKGIDAEKLRLPCFEQIDEAFPLRQTLQTFLLIDQPTSVFSEVVKKCSGCKENIAKYKCSSCKCMWYCSKDCQAKDWKIHKLVCVKQ